MSTVFISGPAFERPDTEYWKSITGKMGAHYNTYALTDPELGIPALKELFGKDECDDLNFLLLGTSGVHGSYTKLNELEESTKKYGFGRWTDEENDPPDDRHYSPEITFVVVQPRLVCIRFGNALLRSQEDIDWLRKVARTVTPAVESIMQGCL